MNSKQRDKFCKNITDMVFNTLNTNLNCCYMEIERIVNDILYYTNENDENKHKILANDMIQKFNGCGFDEHFNNVIAEYDKRIKYNVALNEINFDF